MSDDKIGTCESCRQPNIYLNKFGPFGLCNYCYKEKYYQKDTFTSLRLER